MAAPQVLTLLLLLRLLLQSRAALAAENLVLRQQIAVLQSIGGTTPDWLGAPSSRVRDRRTDAGQVQASPRQATLTGTRVFLNNHGREIAAIDFFTVSTMHFRILVCFLVLQQHRRAVVHFKVTRHPTGRWTTRQIVEASPYDTAP